MDHTKKSILRNQSIHRSPSVNASQSNNHSASRSANKSAKRSAYRDKTPVNCTLFRSSSIERSHVDDSPEMARNLSPMERINKFNIIDIACSHREKKQIRTAIIQDGKIITVGNMKTDLNKTNRTH